MSKYNRHQSVVSRNTDEHVSEDHWLKQFEKSLQKGAVQPKSQQSLYDQINSIMNGGGSKYPSVQSAVDDMMQRSGLSNYLKTSEEKEVTTKTASDETSDEPDGPMNISNTDHIIDAIKKEIVVNNWYEVGKNIAKLELAEGQEATNAMDNIVGFKYFHDPMLKNVRVPVDRWGDFTLGYAAGRGMTHEQTKLQTKLTQSVIERSLGRKASSDQNNGFDKNIPVEPKQEDTNVPDIVKENPAILQTLENYVRSTRGNLPIPAILDKLRSIHKSDVSQDRLWEDDKLIRLISKLNLQAKQNNPSNYQNYSNLAAGDRDTAASDVDPSNTDAFNALMPAKL